MKRPAALLDTSALITSMDTDAMAALPFERLVVSSLTYAELRLGLVTAKDRKSLDHRTARLIDIAQLLGPGLPFDDACAREYERITRAAVDQGQRPRANTMDRMIAASAVAHRMPIITRNSSDLRGLEDLVEVIEL
ncbi:PIN domain-containing protein [Microbacterium sp. NPDC089987]|uniref:PIN domain-containing protein n=1 Tax=Microbacterium sp. NPDC089987 TaxID=3364202 RepID=UPI00382FE9AA